MLQTEASEKGQGPAREKTGLLAQPGWAPGNMTQEAGVWVSRPGSVHQARFWWEGLFLYLLPHEMLKAASIFLELDELVAKVVAMKWNLG